MADVIRKVDYYKAQVQNKAGEGARILSALRGEGINLLFFTGFPRGRMSQLDFVPANGPAEKISGFSGESGSTFATPSLSKVFAM